MAAKTTRSPNAIKRLLRSISQRSVVALMATFVSICALAVSLYQTRLARQQQLAAVWPYLSIGGHGTANAGSQSWGIQVANKGLGPAIIDSLTVVYAGKSQTFKTLINAVYAESAQLDSIRSLNYAINEISRKTVISAGATVELLSYDLKFSGGKSDNPVSEKFLSKIGLRIYYKSLYGERWESCFNCRENEDGVKKLD